MPRDNLPEQDTPPRQLKKPNWLDRMFDGKSDGIFVKRILSVMLIIATIVQPVSLIYTAYAGHGEFTWENWWHFAPALAVFLFVALDWTIMPMAYFFATTNKPGLKIMLAVMLVVVAGGAFDGYFVAAERLIAMRLEEITKYSLKKEAAEKALALAKTRQEEMEGQQVKDRAHLDKQRADLSAKVATIDKQIATILADQAADKAQHPKTIVEIREACRLVTYTCIGPKMDAELAREKEAQATFTKELAIARADKEKLNGESTRLGANDEKKVDAANEAVEKAQLNLERAGQEFDEQALNNQVYRWASVLHFKSARDVTADQANRILMIFAGMVAAGYVVTQVMLAISYYGRDRKGLIQSTKVNWSLAARGARAYYARKRRGVYREKKVVEYVPTSERTRVVYVPVNPGGPVPPAEEFVSKSATPLKAASND